MNTLVLAGEIVMSDRGDVMGRINEDDVIPYWVLEDY